MRIGSNRLRELRSFFLKELSGIYSQGEIQALFNRAADSVLGYTPAQVAARLDENLNQSDMLRFYDCAKDLARHIPLQYILGETWFYGLKLLVNRHVLIPRPETEELVHLALEKFTEENGSLLDVGTGSGCIPVAIKKHRPQTEVHACDVSVEALAVAAENARTNGVRIQFFPCDVLREKPKGSFDVIVSNPPYILADERPGMEKQVLDHEPSLALFVEGSDGVIFFRKIIDLCGEHLVNKGMLFFELNPLTSGEVKAYADASGFFEYTRLIKDISGKQRFFYGRRH